ncbi:MAG TPA: Sec-independent protein translocase subunit TatA [Tetrasphaera sp.]|uniref:Sec-independent protein translocase subunit TatA n=1 Tax=Nostocoides sp. TaxID=1917966 RepID=UPI002B6D58B6|nr:Sec-independent protein translocase subunit TatA [Tetrasphaera sp.]HNQ06383.1 Sec-independent protein translocase subunit TatA [Tetrasphaera sp.]
MPSLGAPELIIIALVVILLFGWKRLPDAARSLGRSARVFKAEVNEMKAEDQARKDASSPQDGNALRDDKSPRTDNQS